MISLTVLTGWQSLASFKTRSNLVVWSVSSLRWYAKHKPPCDPLKENPPCRRAYDDITPAVDPNCPEPCDPYKKKKGILHKIKLRITEGGTNFGTPFRWLDCKPCKAEKEEPEREEKEETTKAIVKKPKEVIPCEEERPGLQVSVLGADTGVGQYVALLLKQCPYMKKLRLYESKCPEGCTRCLANVVQDLLHINTNCRVQAFSCQNFELERCLQNSDIVLMLDSGYVTRDMSIEARFAAQAPLVKCYTDAIATECPKAFIIVAATPIECMVPMIAETLRSSGWYDPARVLGSLAVPEMRASTLAARSLGLEPWYTKVPCVGGTEGESLVPLFSRAVDYYEFCEQTAEYMTNCVRSADEDILRCEGHCARSSDLSEAHALTRLVSQVAQALLCLDIPRVTGFVETNSVQLVSPANYLAIEVILNKHGICHQFDFPRHMNNYEICLLEHAMDYITHNVNTSRSWFFQNQEAELRSGKMGMITQFGCHRNYDHVYRYRSYIH
ncbi:malate dehydrogenase, mitochondrial-like isoform X1 [Cydia strobilella]|uniref:malate dehydrogenase, mitochondrial-like isoform X1 n=1 Tax=Cydia strobilella TaxID=1100964 RepID=UPI0030053F74